MQFILLSVAFLTKNALSENTAWDYEHMDTWKDINPFCGAVDESPINIDTKSIITLADDERCSLPFQWDIDTTVNTFKIKNNGHSVGLQAVQEPSTTNGEWTTLSSNTNVIARFPNYFRDSLIPEYCLDGVHFHWGLDSFTGAEHKIDGKQYPLEAHFVHFNCDRPNLEETLEAYPDSDAVDSGHAKGDVHELAVVSVFFEASDTKTNPEFDELFGGDEKTEEFIQYAYEEHSEASAPEDGEIVTGNLEALLPGNLWTEGYYSYAGSLTTPPCTNIVRWYVMKATGIIGEEQLNTYFKPLQNTTEVDDFIAPNFRDIQSQNVNPVYECFMSPSDSSDSSDSDSSDSDSSDSDSDSSDSDSSGKKKGKHSGDSAEQNDEKADDVSIEDGQINVKLLIINISIIATIALLLIVLTIIGLKCYYNKVRKEGNVVVMVSNDSDCESESDCVVELVEGKYTVDNTNENAILNA